MQNLSGHWMLKGIPYNWKQASLEIKSSGGEVTGRAAFLINSQALGFEVGGGYNGAALDIYFRSDDGMINFAFSGNCEGDNIFKGGIEGDIKGIGTISHINT